MLIGSQLKYKMALLLVCGCLVWFFSGLFVGDRASDKDSVFGTADVGAAIALQELNVEGRRVVRLLHAGVSALQSVDVVARTGGRVEAIFLESGSSVEKDQIILKLEERERIEALGYAKELLVQRKLEYDAAENLGFTGHSTQMQEQAALVGLKAAEMNYKSALLAYENISVKAPFSGVIDRVMPQVGSTVVEGQPVVKISNFDKLRVATYVSESDVSHISPGNEVKVILDNGAVLTGEVCFVGRVATPETMSYRVEMLVDNEEDSLVFSDGMSARVELVLREVRSYKVPASSLSITDAGDIGIKVLDSGGVVRFVNAEIVDDDSKGNVWVTGDFANEGRITLVMRGHEYVTNGAVIANRGS